MLHTRGSLRKLSKGEGGEGGKSGMLTLGGGGVNEPLHMAPSWFQGFQNMKQARDRKDYNSAVRLSSRRRLGRTPATCTCSSHTHLVPLLDDLLLSQLGSPLLVHVAGLQLGLQFSQLQAVQGGDSIVENTRTCTCTTPWPSSSVE